MPEKAVDHAERPRDAARAPQIAAKQREIFRPKHSLRNAGGARARAARPEFRLPTHAVYKLLQSSSALCRLLRQHDQQNNTWRELCDAIRKDSVSASRAALVDEIPKALELKLGVFLNRLYSTLDCPNLVGRLTTPHSSLLVFDANSGGSSAKNKLSLADKLCYSPVDLLHDVTAEEFAAYLFSLQHLNSVLCFNRIARIRTRTAAAGANLRCQPEPRGAADCTPPGRLAAEPDGGGGNSAATPSGRPQQKKQVNMGTAYLLPPLDFADPLVRMKVELLTTYPTNLFNVFLSAIASFLRYTHQFKRIPPELESVISLFDFRLDKVPRDAHNAAAQLPLFPAESKRDSFEKYDKAAAKNAQPPKELELVVTLGGKDTRTLTLFELFWVYARARASSLPRGEELAELMPQLLAEYEAKLLTQTPPLLKCDVCGPQSSCENCVALSTVFEYSKKGNTSFLLVEYPGYFGSDVVPSKQVLVEHAVKSVLKAMALYSAFRVKISFLAHSLGCAVALECASVLQRLLRAPFDPDWLQLSAPKLAAFRSNAQPAEYFREGAITNIVLFAPFKDTADVVAQQLERTVMFPFSRLLGSVVRSMLPASVHWDNVAALNLYLRELRGDRLHALENGFRLPKFIVVHGVRDQICSWRDSEELSRTIRAALGGAAGAPLADVCQLRLLQRHNHTSLLNAHVLAEVFSEMQ